MEKKLNSTYLYSRGLAAHNFLSKTLKLLIITLSFIMASNPCQANIPNNKLHNPTLIDKELKQLKAKVSALEKNITKQQRQESQAVKLLAETDKKIGIKSEEIRKLKQKISEKQKVILDCNHKIAQLTKRSAEQQVSLGKLIDNKFRQHEGPLSLFLKQKSLDNYSKLQHYYNLTIEAQNAQIKQYIALLKETNLTKEKRQNEKNKLTALQTALNNESQILTQNNQERKHLIAKLNGEIKSNADRLNRMKKNETQLSELLTELKNAASWIPENQETPKRFAETKGKLRLPIHNKNASLQPYQASKNHTEQKNKFYIPTKEGTLVYAVHEGRVIFSEWLRGFGLLMIIDHGDGYMSLYGHNQTLYKSTGDWVQAHEAITRVGKTGGIETNSCLYFEIRKDGQPLDLTQWIATA